ncbi:putative glycosyl transferase [Calothrix sp. NIES-4071]|nr:putative glycosyl transferase [Calothrix sp. NIES-4071]BAZ59451.1 putative glycosyl transferase [Calothrix sp. NIES-4105]
MTMMQNSQFTLVDPMLTHQTNGHNEVGVSESGERKQPTVALLPCCDVFEDFFDTIGLSLETFCNELTGGWMFNYIEALQLAGVRTVLFFVSSRVSETVRLKHQPTGATICVMPSPKIYRAYRAMRRQAVDVSGGTIKAKASDVQAKVSNRRSRLEAIKDGIKSLGSYVSTPLGLLIKELRREGCDAILCQDYEYVRFDTCVLLGKLMRLPVFATFQGGERLASIVEYPSRWLAMRLSTGLIIATQTEIQRVRANYSVAPAKIARIFNPMNVMTWRAINRDKTRAALGIPTDATVVVYHGRMEIWLKGLDILLEAWNQICRERPGKELRLLLVGTGSDANELQQQITNMQLQGVVWVNEYVRSRTAIQQYLSAADVYTLPSRKEGFPVAPIEAMACGLPVVATDAPGVPDILEKGEESGGIVVPRNDVAALALALGRVLDDSSMRHQLGKAARCRAEECFSLEAIGKQLRDFLLTSKTSI